MIGLGHLGNDRLHLPPNRRSFLFCLFSSCGLKASVVYERRFFLMCRRMRKQDDFFFDDCLVCRAQKKADEEGRPITKDELHQALKEAKASGAIVGGDCIVE